MQTTFNTSLEAFLQGQVTPHASRDQITLMATADIAFGMPVKRVNAGDEGTITGVGEAIVGIVRHEHNDKGLMVAGSELAVLTQGAIAVPTQDTPVVGGIAYFDPLTAKYTNVATDNIQVGVFQTPVKNDTLAVVKINILG